MEGDVITLQDLFLFDFHAGADEHGRFRGTLQPHRPAPAVPRPAGRPRHPRAARNLRAGESEW